MAAEGAALLKGMLAELQKLPQRIAALTNRDDRRALSDLAGTVGGAVASAVGAVGRAAAAPWQGGRKSPPPGPQTARQRADVAPGSPAQSGVPSAPQVGVPSAPPQPSAQQPPKPKDEYSTGTLRGMQFSPYSRRDGGPDLYGATSGLLGAASPFTGGMTSGVALWMNRLRHLADQARNFGETLKASREERSPPPPEAVPIEPYKKAPPLPADLAADLKARRERWLEGPSLPKPPARAPAGPTTHPAFDTGGVRPPAGPPTPPPNAPPGGRPPQTPNVPPAAPAPVTPPSQPPVGGVEFPKPKPADQAAGDPFRRGPDRHERDLFGAADALEHRKRGAPPARPEAPAQTAAWKPPPGWRPVPSEIIQPHIKEGLGEKKMAEWDERARLAWERRGAGAPPAVPAGTHGQPTLPAVEGGGGGGDGASADRDELLEENTDGLKDVTEALLRVADALRSQKGSHGVGTSASRVPYAPTTKEMEHPAEGSKLGGFIKDMAKVTKMVNDLKTQG